MEKKPEKNRFKAFLSLQAKKQAQEFCTERVFTEVVQKLREVSLIYQNFKLRCESQRKSEGIENDLILNRRYRFVAGKSLVLNFNKKGVLPFRLHCTVVLLS